ncbi:Inner membrane protein YbcI [hydrothermal vent metagenome]|uniref:Inner membrane protein YbcI n=1 Tax=hydrothermal vent metagenome TaxID=652676 RepID=A0A3B1A7R0_9ZZZZ
MASAFAHALVAYTGKKLYPEKNYPCYSWRILLFAIIWSIAPDIDSIGFFLGIPYADLFGHRGLSHSIFFAVISSVFLVKFFFPDTAPWNNRLKLNISLVLFFSLIMSSHGILDAMTSGGLGVAFFAPFDNSRYFFPWRPISVSPIGIKSFFSEWGLRVIVNEAIWIGLPCSIILIATMSSKFIRKK